MFLYMIREYESLGWSTRSGNKKPAATLSPSDSLQAVRAQDSDIENSVLNEDHPDLSLPKKFGNSNLFVDSIAVAEYQGRPLADHMSVKNGRPPGALLEPRPPLDAPTVAEAIAVISCWYEENTEWGERIGWIYGSVTEDVFWAIGGSSAHLAAVIQGLLKVTAGIEISFTLTSKSAAEDEDDIYADLYVVKWTSLFIMPLTICITNIVAVIMGTARTLFSVIPQWNKLVGGAFFSFWVLAHMYPFMKGLMGRKGKVTTIIYVWVGLLSITVSLLWIIISPPDDPAKF
nr:cellulose synthase-like protein D1 [Tanacetum cinerariifolium]